MTSKTGLFRSWTFTGTVLLVLLLVSGISMAQTHPTAAKTVPALLLSDVHFEPFTDPGKAAQLNAAPVSQWKAILEAPASVDQAERFAALQQGCHAKGVDTSEVLLQSSLRAMQSQAAGAKFITVSGDLIAHAFPCKYNALFPHAAAGDYRAFVEKTLDYVQAELHRAFPGVALFVALGNNDSDCGDYQLDTHSEFLAAEGKIVSSDFPALERKTAEESFAAAGYYSVSLPAPIHHARLLVLNDLFMARHYSTCADKPDSSGSVEQLLWLEQQLALARKNQEKVWVMSHIPPGVDLHGTGTKILGICEGKKPTEFLASDLLSDLLGNYSDVVQLAIFAHTHMDELRLLKPEAPSPDQPGVAVKMVASISAVHGNNPSFTVAQVDAATAELRDYKVIAASNQTGDHALWQEEYDFAKAYHVNAFSAASLDKLIHGFEADPSAKTEASQEYLHTVFTGGQIPLLNMFWPQYACSLSHASASSYKACVCSNVQ